MASLSASPLQSYDPHRKQFQTILDFESVVDRPFFFRSLFEQMTGNFFVPICKQPSFQSKAILVTGFVGDDGFGDLYHMLTVAKDVSSIFKKICLFIVVENYEKRQPAIQSLIRSSLRNHHSLLKNVRILSGDQSLSASYILLSTICKKYQLVLHLPSNLPLRLVDTRNMNTDSAPPFLQGFEYHFTFWDGHCQESFQNHPENPIGILSGFSPYQRGIFQETPPSLPSSIDMLKDANLKELLSRGETFYGYIKPSMYGTTPRFCYQSFLFSCIASIPNPKDQMINIVMSMDQDDFLLTFNGNFDNHHTLNERLEKFHAERVDSLLKQIVPLNLQSLKDLNICQIELYQKKPDDNNFDNQIYLVIEDVGIQVRIINPGFLSDHDLRILMNHTNGRSSQLIGCTGDTTLTTVLSSNLPHMPWYNIPRHKDTFMMFASGFANELGLKKTAIYFRKLFDLHRKFNIVLDCQKIPMNIQDILSQIAKLSIEIGQMSYDLSLIQEFSHFKKVVASRSLNQAYINAACRAVAMKAFKDLQQKQITLLDSICQTKDFEQFSKAVSSFGDAVSLNCVGCDVEDFPEDHKEEVSSSGVETEPFGPDYEDPKFKISDD